MRYKLDENIVPHPWRKRRAPDGTLLPAWHSVRGIKDTTTGEWHAVPTLRAQSQFQDVRTLNGMPPLTPQKVRAVLKRAGINFSESHSTRIRGWHNTTSGTTVWQTETGELCVGYNVNHWTKDPDFPKLLAPAFKALQQAGLNPTQRDDGLITL